MGAKAAAVPPRKWTVTIEMSREYEIVGGTAKEAEEAARDLALFDAEYPVDRDDIDEIKVSWRDAADVWHFPGCYGHHCSHYECETDENEGAEDYHEYCANCDPE